MKGNKKESGKRTGYENTKVLKSLKNHDALSNVNCVFNNGLLYRLGINAQNRKMLSRCNKCILRLNCSAQITKEFR